MTEMPTGLQTPPGQEQGYRVLMAWSQEPGRYQKALRPHLGQEAMCPLTPNPGHHDQVGPKRVRQEERGKGRLEGGEWSRHVSDFQNSYPGSLVP